MGWFGGSRGGESDGRVRVERVLGGMSSWREG